MEFETIKEKADTAHAALQVLNHDNKDHKLKIADIDKRMVNKIDSKQFFDFQTIAMKSISSLNDTVPTLATKPSVALVELRVKDLETDLPKLNSNLYKNYYTSATINEMISKEKERIESTYLRQVLHKTDLEKIEKNLNLIKIHGDDVDKKIEFLKSRLSDFNSQLHSKVNTNEFNELKEYSMTLCKYSDLKILYDKVIPPIRNFEENMVILEKDMDCNKEIIRRFDEILSEKASKVSVEELINMFTSYVKIDQYNKDREENISRIDTYEVQFNSLEKSFKDLSEVVDYEIKSAVRKGIKEVKNELFAKNRSSSTVTIEDVEEMLSSKIERTELEYVLDLKSNKVDTQSNMQAVDIIHKQIKHLTVLIIEILRKEVMKFMKMPDNESSIK